jgi:TonB family protein
MVLAVRVKTGRLEALSKASGERYKKSDFQVLARINVAEMGQKKVSVPKIGYIKKLTAGEEIEYDSSPIEQESNEEFEKSLKWSSIIHAAILLLAFLTYWTHSLFIEPEAPVVKLTKPQKVIKTVKPQPREVVKASNKKINRKKKVVKKRVRKVAPKKVRRARKKSVNQMGALAALGGTSKGSKSGKGLKLKSASRNSGSGDSLGRKSLGQANNSFAGKALSAPSGGNGKTRLGGVGYGTKGRSGGQAGYGKLNIGGSAGGGYVHPLQEDGTVEGGLEMSQIEAVIRKNIGQIYYCYEKGLQANSGLSGRVAVNFIINGGGRVRLAQIGQSSLGSSTVERCMIGKIKQWRFPKPHGNVDVNVSYPFILRRAKHG